jgi:phosphoribosylformylglycinamidine synthase
VPEVLVLQNRKPEHIAASARLLAEKLAAAQMLILPGGFSGGDEPEGSAKLICAFFCGERVRDAVLQMLACRDALILGICNGFQALLKLGLVPDGTIHREQAASAPTLTFNTIARHQSRMVRTRVCSTLSPWFSREEAGALHYIPVSHGEGRFVAGEQTLRTLAERGQIATRYVDEHGQPSSAIAHNPAGSMFAIEGISSADGRVLGKMAHSERLASGLYRNLGAPAPCQKLFESGVYYFTA